MECILSLRAPWFHAEIARQYDPALAGRPLLVISGRGPGGRVIGLSQEAAEQGAEEGSPWRQASRRCDEAAIALYDPEMYQPAAARIAEVLNRFTPWIEKFPGRESELFAGLGGYEPDLARQLAIEIQESVAAELRLSVSIGAASGRLAARSAANKAAAGSGGGAPLLIPPGRDRAFLAPLPAAALWELRPEALRRLDLLGLRTLGQIAALSPRDLALSLGAGAYRYVRLARGQDDRPVTPWRPEPSEVACMRIEVDQPSTPYLDHLLRDMAADLARRLAHGARAARALALSLYLADGRRLTELRGLKQAAYLPETLLHPSRILLASLLQRLQAEAPGESPQIIELSLSRFEEAGAVQLSLFGRSDRTTLLRAAIARLQARFGGRHLMPARDHLHPDLL